MRKWILAAAVALVFAGTACTQQTSATYSNASGSVALSRDDSLVYAVDTDNEIVAVIDAATQKKIAEVKVGAAPEQIVVAPDDTLYVSNRGSRSVSVIEKGQWSEAARIAVGVEPTGLAVSPDSKILYVVNGTSLESADYGTLTAIDTESRQIKWDLPVGQEPRAIALTDGGKKALITLFKQGDLVQVDLSKPEVIRDNTQATDSTGQHRSALYVKANESALTNSGSAYPGGFSRFQPTSASSITVSPDGKSAYTTVTWAREDDISRPPNSFGGYYAAGGPCNLGAVASQGLVTYHADNAEPTVDDITSCAYRTQSESSPYPTTVVGTPNGDPIQGGVASVVDPTGSWLFVLNRESRNVAIMPTSRRGGDDLHFNSTGTSVRDLVTVGQGANGLAITHDGKTLYVYNQFDHNLSVLTARHAADGRSVVSEQTKIQIAPPDATEFALGRKLFFDATNADLNNPQTTGVSCNTCHTEGGREDGHVWGFPDGKRQTPALAGRMIAETAPYHWSGEFNTLNDFMQHTTVLRMGGAGVNTNEYNELIAYMDQTPLPDNPNLKAAPTDAQLRGKEVFQQAGCGSCHGGQAFTLNTMADVGTIRSTDKQTHDATSPQLTVLNTPSLLGLARTAPYLHDGSAATLKERITQSTQNKHGNTDDLTPAQVDDLVEYLKTL